MRFTNIDFVYLERNTVMWVWWSVSITSVKNKQLVTSRHAALQNLYLEHRRCCCTRTEGQEMWGDLECDGGIKILRGRSGSIGQTREFEEEEEYRTKWLIWSHLICICLNLGRDDTDYPEFVFGFLSHSRGIPGEYPIHWRSPNERDHPLIELSFYAK